MPAVTIVGVGVVRQKDANSVKSCQRCEKTKMMIVGKVRSKVALPTS